MKLAIGDKVKVNDNMHFLHPREFSKEVGVVKVVRANGIHVIVRFPKEERSVEMVDLCIVKKAAIKWEFESRSYLDIDLALIHSELTHKNPIALIDIEDNCGVLVHDSIMVKAAVSYLPNPEGETFTLAELEENGKYHIYQCEIEDFAKWISWASVVKNAAWPKEYKAKTMVKITLPNIE